MSEIGSTLEHITRRVPLFLIGVIFVLCVIGISVACCKPATAHADYNLWEPIGEYTYRMVDTRHAVVCYRYGSHVQTHIECLPLRGQQ